MAFMVENWFVFIGVIAVAGVIGVGIGKFLNLPTAAQIGKVKEWLLWACIQAEKELGNGTGGIKLRQVYDMFVARFPVVAKAVSFETFGQWVDGALEEMRRMLTENKAMRVVVGGESGGES